MLLYRGGQVFALTFQLSLFQLTVADLYLMSLIGFLGDFCPNTMAKYPDLKEYKEEISAIPEIKKWIEIRPKTTV